MRNTIDKDKNKQTRKGKTKKLKTQHFLIFFFLCNSDSVSISFVHIFSNFSSGSSVMSSMFQLVPNSGEDGMELKDTEIPSL